MDTNPSPDLALDQQLRSQVEQLRSQFPQTGDIYREVCILLFFRYGVTPTANKLYQLVRKGSMSAPTQALTLFWKDLREKSRVRIEQPDLPDALRQTAGELVSGLWGNAQSLAQQSLAVFRQEANAAMLEAQSGQAEAEEQQKRLNQELVVAQQNHAAAVEQNQSLGQQLAAAAAAGTRLEAELAREREAKEQLQQALDATRADLEVSRHNLKAVTGELESTRQQSQATQERLTADITLLNTTILRAETRFMEEKSRLSDLLDQARTKSDHLQKEIESIRLASAAAAEQYRLEASKLHQESGQLRQQLGILQGTLQGVNAQREELSSELRDLRSQQSVLAGEVRASRAEAEIWKGQAHSLEEKLATLSGPGEQHPA
jgi:chromosome segregation ATPase